MSQRVDRTSMRSNLLEGLPGDMSKRGKRSVNTERKPVEVRLTQSTRYSDVSENVKNGLFVTELPCLPVSAPQVKVVRSKSTVVRKLPKSPPPRSAASRNRRLSTPLGLQNLARDDGGIQKLTRFDFEQPAINRNRCLSSPLGYYVPSSQRWQENETVTHPNSPIQREDGSKTQYNCIESVHSTAVRGLLGEVDRRPSRVQYQGQPLKWHKDLVLSSEFSENVLNGLLGERSDSELFEDERDNHQLKSILGDLPCPRNRQLLTPQFGSERDNNRYLGIGEQPEDQVNKFDLQNLLGNVPLPSLKYRDDGVKTRSNSLTNELSDDFLNGMLGFKLDEDNLTKSGLESILGDTPAPSLKWCKDDVVTRNKGLNHFSENILNGLLKSDSELSKCEEGQTKQKLKDILGDMPTPRNCHKVAPFEAVTRFSSFDTTNEFSENILNGLLGDYSCEIDGAAAESAESFKDGLENILGDFPDPSLRYRDTSPKSPPLAPLFPKTSKNHRLEMTLGISGSWQDSEDLVMNFTDNILNGLLEDNSADDEGYADNGLKGVLGDLPTPSPMYRGNQPPEFCQNVLNGLLDETLGSSEDEMTESGLKSILGDLPVPSLRYRHDGVTMPNSIDSVQSTAFQDMLGGVKSEDIKQLPEDFTENILKGLLGEKDNILDPKQSPESKETNDLATILHNLPKPRLSAKQIAEERTNNRIKSNLLDGLLGDAPVPNSNCVKDNSPKSNFLKGFLGDTPVPSSNWCVEDISTTSFDESAPPTPTVKWHQDRTRIQSNNPAKNSTMNGLPGGPPFQHQTYSNTPVPITSSDTFQSTAQNNLVLLAPRPNVNHQKEEKNEPLICDTPTAKTNIISGLLMDIPVPKRREGRTTVKSRDPTVRTHVMKRQEFADKPNDGKIQICDSLYKDNVANSCLKDLPAPKVHRRKNRPRIHSDDIIKNSSTNGFLCDPPKIKRSISGRNKNSMPEDISPGALNWYEDEAMIQSIDSVHSNVLRGLNGEVPSRVGHTGNKWQMDTKPSNWREDLVIKNPTNEDQAEVQNKILIGDLPPPSPKSILGNTSSGSRRPVSRNLSVNWSEVLKRYEMVDEPEQPVSKNVSHVSSDSVFGNLFKGLLGEFVPLDCCGKPMLLKDLLGKILCNSPPLV